MVDPKLSFQRWYVEPLRKLRELPNGDGGFVALSTSCFLYERYAVAAIKKRGKKADRDAKISQFTSDFKTDKTTAQAFWTIIRDGILHQAMPKTGKSAKAELPGWAFHGSLKRPVGMGKANGKDILLVEPWLFTDTVVKLWEDNLELLDKSESFPWAQVGPIIFTQDGSHEQQ